MRKLTVIKGAIYSVQLAAGALVCFFIPVPFQFFVGWLFKSITDWGWKVLSQDARPIEINGHRVTLSQMEDAVKAEIKRLKSEAELKQSRAKEVSNG
jgi:hypothetical protein